MNRTMINFMEENRTVHATKVEKQVTAAMLNMSVPKHLRGFQYLREAIAIVEQDMEMAGSVTKLLYPVVAKRFHTTGTKVERAIRNAIEVSWEQGEIEACEDMFGYSADNSSEHPTNSEYIAIVADRIRRQEDNE
ncbi:MAG: sporulation initiation factor Spo0A C-terminal domain-containing protein [Lachnospiraceae bacterium]